MKNIAWNWLTAFRMLVIAVLPVSLLLTGNVQVGLVLSIGVIPAAVIPLAESKVGRLRLVLVGVLFGASIITGSILSQSIIVAAIGIGLLAFGSAYLMATRFSKLSALAIGLCLPVVGIGFSFPDVSEALGLSCVIIGGSLWALLVSLPFPGLKQSPAQPKPVPSKQQAITFGVSYALAATVATVGPLVLGWDHVGWVAGATLFVMRPAWGLQKSRMTGRVVSVFIGALLASLILAVHPPVGVVAILITTAIVLAGATQGITWYITPLFSTFIVFFVLLYVDTPAGAIAYRLNERVIETIVGVAIAGVFGLLLVMISTRFIRR
jgi:hypothetical protein